MTVRSQLVAVFAVMATVLLFPAGYAVIRLAELRDIAVEERGRHAAASLALGRLSAGLADLDRYERSYVAAPDSALRAAVRRTMSWLHRELEYLDAARYGSATEELRRTVARTAELTVEIDSLVAGGRLVEATEAFARLAPLVEEAEERLGSLAAAVDRRAQEDFERARVISDSARSAILAAIGLSLVVAVLLGGWATGTLTVPLRRLTRATAGVARGDFRTPESLPYDRPDEIGALAGSFRAMTERLAELDRLKAEFIGVASHELKTPINVIRGYADLIEEELTEDLTEHQREILRGIVEQAHVMSRLVSRLMDLTRLETGRYRLEVEEVHLEDVVTGLVRAFDVLSHREGIAIVTEILPSAPRILVVDVDAIRDDVLGNLVSNALKFTPRGGEVRITAWGEEHADGTGAVIEVADTGPGIPEEHRPHIFEKYYQVERSRAVGTGLGLAIAKEVVEAHGGEIRLEPPGDAGARFRIRLPVRPASASPHPPGHLAVSASAAYTAPR